MATIEISQSPDSRPVQLTALPAGAEALLCDSRLSVTDREVLAALGLTDACRLRVCQTGDPWIVQVHTTRIGIAEPVARELLVLPEPPR